MPKTLGIISELLFTFPRRTTIYSKCGASPRFPWQRANSENTNCRRRFLPRDFDIHRTSRQQELDKIVKQVMAPLGCLVYQTPTAVETVKLTSVSVKQIKRGYSHLISKVLE